jgi:hypothetical protein
MTFTFEKTTFGELKIGELFTFAEKPFYADVKIKMDYTDDMNVSKYPVYRLILKDGSK